MSIFQKTPWIPVLLVAFAVGVAGCDSPSSGSGGSQPTSQPSGGAAPALSNADLHALYDSDVAGFAQVDESALAQFDQQQSQLLTKIFGGPTDADVIEYYNERIHYAYTEQDLDSATLTPADFPNQGWLTDANAGSSSNAAAQSDSSPSDSEIGALNISTLFWLEGVVNNTPVTLTVGSTVIPIDSTRTGVIVLGGGYIPTVNDSEGNPHVIPVAYRQAILVHEGRHSDCTDGLPQSEIELMRAAKSEEQYASEVPLPHCGHTHVICPSGTYQGVAACDAEQYGAYTIGAIYEAALIGAQTDEDAQKILQASAIDYFSRYIGSGNSTAPDEQSPNMTSGGVDP